MMSTLSPTADYTVEDQLRMRAATRYFNWLLALSKPWLGNRVLEIGCGMGNFTRTILDRELIVGLDVEAHCIAQHKRNHSGCDHVVSLEMDASDPASVGALHGYQFDSVVSLNVFEHIQDDYQAMRNLWQLLPEGGRVVLVIPAFSALYGPIDHLLGHYRRYTKKSVRELAKATGFEPIQLYYVNFVGFFGWWANSRIFKRTEQSESQIAIFDRFVVPWLRPLEAVIHPPLGQSVFTVLEKRTSGK